MKQETLWKVVKAVERAFYDAGCHKDLRGSQRGISR